MFTKISYFSLDGGLFWWYNIPKVKILFFRGLSVPWQPPCAILKGGVNMASGAVNEVLEAERLAKERIEAAKAEAAEILHRAETESTAQRERIVAEAEEKKRKMTEAAHISSKESAEEAHRIARDEADRILRDSEKMTEEAVKAVLKIIG